MALFVLVVPLIVVVAVAGLRWPLRFMFAAYAFILPFGSGIELPIGMPPPFNTLSTLIGLFATLAILAHLALVPRRANRIHPSVPLWLIFTGIAGLTFIWSANPADRGDDYAVLVSLVALYVAASLMPVEREDVDRIEKGIAGGGAVTGIYALVLLATGSLPQTGGGTPRFATAGGAGEGGTDPNITAAALLLPLAIAAARAIRAEESRRGRILFGISGALAGAAILLTGSRGGLLAGVVILAMLTINEGRRVVIGWLAGGAVALTVLTLSLAPGALIGHLGKETSSGRTDIWRVGLSACQSYCLTGSGWSTFQDVYRDALGDTPNAREFGFKPKAHNVFLRLAIETGILGLAVAIAALILHLREAALLPRAVRGPPLAGIVGVLIANMFLSNIDFKYFWVVLIYGTLTTLQGVEAEQRIRVAPRLRPVLAG